MLLLSDRNLNPADLTKIQARVQAGIADKHAGRPPGYREHWMQATLAEHAAEIGWSGRHRLEREFPARRPGGGTGYIDFLRLDDSGTLHITETKIGHDEMLILQGLDYWIWAQANIALLAAHEQISRLEVQVEAHFLQHPDAETYLPQPGIGPVNGARVLAEFGDAPGRYASAKARKNYAGSSPLTRASGRSRVVVSRYIRNDRLADALQSQALSALTASPGARAYYDKQRARGLGHNPALRQLSNRLVGILHGCLKTSTRYNEATAWPAAVTHNEQLAA